MLGVRSAYRAEQIDRSSDFLISLYFSEHQIHKEAGDPDDDVQENDTKSGYDEDEYLPPL